MTGVCVPPVFSTSSCICSEGFSWCEGSCWHTAAGLTNHSGAAEYCSALGAQLAVPSSSEENGCASCLVGEGFAWLGIRGGAEPGSFQGADGALTFTSWADGEPDGTACGDNGCDSCVYMGDFSDGWRVAPCGARYTALCQQTGCCAIEG